MEDESLGSCRDVAGEGANVEVAERFGGLGAVDPVEPDEQPSLVGPDALETRRPRRAGGVAERHLEAGTEAVREVGQRRDHDLAPEPVRLHHTADGDEVVGPGRHAGRQPLARRSRLIVSDGCAPLTIHALAFSRSKVRVGGFFVGS